MKILIRHIKGGSGATLIAINLAYEMSRSLKTLLIQVSPYPDLDAYISISEHGEIQKYESMWVARSMGGVDEIINEAKQEFECIIIDIDESVGPELIHQWRDFSEIECIIMNFDPASLMKTKSVDLTDKTFLVINQYTNGNPLLESHTKFSSKIIAKVPTSPEEIIYQLSRKEPFQKRKNGIMKSAIETLAQSLQTIHKQNV